MKVLLVGGYGVFGAKLARLLVIDGHDVCIAGRNPGAATKCAVDLGCHAILLDRSGDLGALTDYDVVIDAAGPFHAYGSDPYRLAHAAIAAGVHYLDLSDNAAFCQGISKLDADARKARVCVVSGLSSVPALSSAAVRALAGEDRPEVIDTAILPGNRAPRGLSVMHSILSQAGRPIPVWRGCQWERAIGWSRPADYILPGGLVRQGWQIEVPDLRLFPAHFGAGTVTFRAGLELWLMRYGLVLFGKLRQVAPIPVTRPVVRVFKLLAQLLSPFGSGRGGMSVSVITGDERRFWGLLARSGYGPFIPAVPARALLRRAVLPVGAGPALEVITLSEAEAAMSDLHVVTERGVTSVAPIFPCVLGQQFDALPVEIRETHLTNGLSRWIGRCEVQRGHGVVAMVLCAMFRFPRASADIEVEVVKSATPDGETWRRWFGQREFRSHMSLAADGLRERFGPFSFSIGLEVRDHQLHYPVTAGRLGFLRLPQWMLPGSLAREFVSNGEFHFDVAVLAPVTKQLVVRYKGNLIAKPPGDPSHPPADEKRS